MAVFNGSLKSMFNIQCSTWSCTTNRQTPLTKCRNSVQIYSNNHHLLRRLVSGLLLSLPARSRRPVQYFVWLFTSSFQAKYAPHNSPHLVVFQVLFMKSSVGIVILRNSHVIARQWQPALGNENLNRYVPLFSMHATETLLSSAALRTYCKDNKGGVQCCQHRIMNCLGYVEWDPHPHTQKKYKVGLVWTSNTCDSPLQHPASCTYRSS